MRHLFHYVREHHHTHYVCGIEWKQADIYVYTDYLDKKQQSVGDICEDCLAVLPVVLLNE